MRMIQMVSLPVDKFNDAVRDGTAGSKISRILEEINPEAAYFSESDGERFAVCVVDVKDASQIPALAEPWFLTFDAKVRFHVAMTPEELKDANLDSYAKKKYR